MGRAAAAALLLALSALAAPAAELFMYRRDGCPYCVRFEREVAPIYPKTREGALAPLRLVQLPSGGVRDGGLKEPVIATPTFVLVEGGREIGRITGYLNDDMFWGLLGQLLAGMNRPVEARKP
nr:thioredoxin family protein [Methylobacterium sp. ZNC0032]